MRARLTYANVMATIAVFIALGGSSYAAVKITGRDVKDGTLTGKDVKDRSLTARDFKGSVRGHRGERGPQGPAGAPAPRPEVVLADLGPGKDVALSLPGIGELRVKNTDPGTDAIFCNPELTLAPSAGFIGTAISLGGTHREGNAAAGETAVLIPATGAGKAPSGTLSFTALERNGPGNATVVGAVQNMPGGCMVTLRRL